MVPTAAGPVCQFKVEITVKLSCIFVVLVQFALDKWLDS